MHISITEVNNEEHSKIKPQNVLLTIWVVEGYGLERKDKLGERVERDFRKGIDSKFSEHR